VFRDLGQRLTLAHFSAQLELFWSSELLCVQFVTSYNPLILSHATETSQGIVQKVLTLSRDVDECSKLLISGGVPDTRCAPPPDHPRGNAPAHALPGRGLHSSTFQLNLGRI